MKIYMFIGCLAMLLIPLSTKAREAYLHAPDTSFFPPESLNERIEVVTDRYIYGVGEKILFSGFNKPPPELKVSCWSKVLYLELLTPGGTSVAQGKFPLSSSGASGYLTVPEQLLTGNYYLVAYTKWMRNFSPIHFHYQLIKIINPYSPQLEASNLSNGNMQTRKWEHIPLKEEITCRVDKASYHQREKVKLSIHIPVSVRSLTNTYSIAVIKDNPYDTLRNLKIKPVQVQYQRPSETMYLPEIKGLSLSGRMLAGDSGGPVANKQVNLSILGREPDFRVINSDPKGTFCFALDSITGRNDMYIASNYITEDFEIRIDNDFANPAVKFPEIPFVLSESEKELAAEIIFNMQINSQFRSSGTSISQKDIREENPQIVSFYGLPSASVLIDDYIDLPTLKEVLIELVPGVFPRLRENRSYLIFSGNKLTFNLINQYSPLILVDHVPVFNLNEIYMVGHTTFGGILNIITRKGDLAGINLPENSFFFDFTSYLPQEELAFPRYEHREFDPENPDYRNCLYWKPGMHAAPGQDLELDFFTSDNNGDYMVLIRSVGKDGTILQGRGYFRVE